jgi:hypothetical protein
MYCAGEERAIVMGGRYKHANMQGKDKFFFVQSVRMYGMVII